MLSRIFSSSQPRSSTQQSKMKFIVFLAAVGLAAALPQWYQGPLAYSAFQPSYYYPIQYFGSYGAPTLAQPQSAVPVFAKAADPSDASASDSFAARGDPSTFAEQGVDYGVYNPQNEFIYINFKKKKVIVGK